MGRQRGHRTSPAWLHALGGTFVGALSLVALHAAGRHLGLHSSGSPRLGPSADVVTALSSPADAGGSGEYRFELRCSPRVSDRRRLAGGDDDGGGEDLQVDGSYQSKCTGYCPPTGGVLSIVGLIAGQCDCFVHVDVNGSNPECPSTYAKDTTCCGSTDNYGGVVFYVAVVFYSFLGLAVICDNYFCESLDKIVEVLKLSDDVAGATFMAAGSSAPELFTALVTVLLTGGSEGLGAIAGSAIFNMMVIVGVVAIAACPNGASLKIWWYPLTRDCIVYVFSIVVMVVFMIDYKVEWWESLLMVLCYLGYIYVMKRNEELAQWAQGLEQGWAEKTGSKEAGAHGGAGVELSHRNNPVAQGQGHGQGGEGTDADAVLRAAAALSALGVNPSPANGGGGGGELTLRAGAGQTFNLGGGRLGVGGVNNTTQQRRDIVSGVQLGQQIGGNGNQTAARAQQLQRYTGGNPLFKPAFREAYTDSAREERRARQRQQAVQSLGTGLEVKKATEVFLSKISKSAKWSGSQSGGGLGAMENGVAAVAGGAGDASGGEDAQGGGGASDLVVALLSKPIEFVFAVTVPDCSTEENKGKFMLTFIMSIVWIGVLSFIMVDFCSRAGCVLGVPPLLMGLIFIAAGTSVPDALSSIAVGKSGMGDMAVANVLGSNVFNIFLGLGLPWCLKALADGKPFMLDPTEPILPSILLLLIYCAIFIALIHMNGWALNTRLGYQFFTLHLIFVIWSAVSFYVSV